MIEVKDLHKQFGDLEVLKGITTTIERGEVVAVIGPSGSGKSTFLRCLNMLEIPTSGTVSVDGFELTKKGANVAKARQNIGMVFQQFNLFPHMSVLDNLTYAPVNVLKVSKTEALERAKKLLERVGLSEKIDAYPSQLSGGQKQRLSIARALVRKPDLYVFDDSFSALDFKTDAALRKALKEETKDATVLIVAQRVSTIMDADRIIVLEEGSVAGIGTHDELFATNAVYQEIVKSQLSEEEIA